MNTAGLLILQDRPSQGEKSVCSIITGWYHVMQEQNGWRAELKRAGDLQALLLCTGFHKLLHSLHSLHGWQANSEWRLSGLALGAGAASHVKDTDNRHSFAAQLGLSKPGTGRPVLSALRFSRLNQANNYDELYRRIIQAIRQLDNRVNLLSLMDGILLWCREYQQQQDSQPAEYSSVFQRPAVRWACEYYQATEMSEE